KGWFKPSAMRPWGYASRPATPDELAAGSPQTVLDVDEQAAEYVAKAFERSAGGASTASVAGWAASLPSEVRGQWFVGTRKTKTGEIVHVTKTREMTKRAVQFILRNPVYAALRWDAKTEQYQPARWPAIVDSVTWHTVQRRMDRVREAPRAAPERYILTGF